MARKSPNLNYAVNAVFYIGQTELAEQLAVFARNKKLAWSPDVKVAMQKRPATVIEDDVFFKLKPLAAKALQGMLVSLLKPIKEHDLFDLSDWLRDLDGVPDYLQSYWSNTRIPKELDDVVALALRTESSNSMAANPAWPLPPKRDATDDSDGEWDILKETKPPKLKKTSPIPRSTKTIKGPKGRGKASKSDVKYVKPEPDLTKAEEASVDVLVDAARQALGDKKMNQLSGKAVWTRVHKAVEALLTANGLAFTATRPVRVDTDDANQKQVTYYIKAVSDGDMDWADFKADFLTEFDGHVADLEAIDDEEPPRSFKVWWQHA